MNSSLTAVGDGHRWGGLWQRQVRSRDFWERVDIWVVVSNICLFSPLPGEMIQFD